MEPPRTMSTQHPDNASPPPWGSELLAGEDEVREVIYAYRELDIGEQMWDWEGKDVDPHVVRKLLEMAPSFFREHILGEDVRLTYRLPNPDEEAGEKKVFAEALETIPLSADVAERFYGRPVAPVFEVILPLTRSARQLVRVASYYRRVVVGKGDVVLDDGTRVEDWVGGYRPRRVEVIPLLEDAESILGLRQIVGGYLDAVKPPHVRVFIARSDPALNYGLVPATLLAVAGLWETRRLSEEHGVPVYPIIGAGPPPFRGHLSPVNVPRFLKVYSGYHTFTIQSAFKYDYPASVAAEAVEALRKARGEPPPPPPPATLRRILGRLSRAYGERVSGLAGLVSLAASVVPQRRARRLHIGLFGYSREGATGVRLPRAIRFTAAMYTLGIPPELLGVSALLELGEEEQALVEEAYPTMLHDLAAAAERLSWDAVNMLLGEREVYERLVASRGAGAALKLVFEDIHVLESNLGVKAGPRSLSGYRYSNAVCNAVLSLAEGRLEEAASGAIEAAVMRRFLG